MNRKIFSSKSIVISFTQSCAPLDRIPNMLKNLKSRTLYTHRLQSTVSTFFPLPTYFPPRYGHLFKFDRRVAKPEIGTGATCKRMHEYVCVYTRFLGRFRRTVSFALRVSNIRSNRKPEMGGKGGERSVIRSISYPEANPMKS